MKFWLLCSNRIGNLTPSECIGRIRGAMLAEHNFRNRFDYLLPPVPGFRTDDLFQRFMAEGIRLRIAMPPLPPCPFDAAKGR